MVLSEDNVRQINLNQIEHHIITRGLNACNGFLTMFGEIWYKKNIEDMSSIEGIIFWRESILLLKQYKGYNKIKKKLKKGLYYENIDFEIAIDAMIIKYVFLLELEPPTIQNKFADNRFKINKDDRRIYVEITKREKIINKVIDKQGDELASLVSKINPNKRCIIICLKELDDKDYSSLIEWLQSMPNEGKFRDIAIFLTGNHNEDETPIVFNYIQPPISVRSNGDIMLGTFGVSYLHKTDKTAMMKINEKKVQLPQNMPGLIFIDMTGIASGLKDWYKQIIFNTSNNHISAIILCARYIDSQGLKWDMQICYNPNSLNALNSEEKELLEKIKNYATNPMSY